MSARPTQFKQGGGFLNGVDGVITDYTFTDEFNGEAWTPGKIKTNDGKTMNRPHSLNCLLSVRADGADEDVSTTLRCGNFDDFIISDDGKTIWDATYETQEEADAAENTRQLGANSGIAKFITSLVDAGFPISSLSDAQSTNFEPIIGARVRFTQRTDERLTKEFGKRKGKNGKEYERQNLVVETVYSVGDDAPAKTAPAKKATTAPAKTAKGKAAEPTVDLKALSTETLLGILDDKDGQITKSKLSMAVTLKLMKHPAREDVKKWLFNDSNLNELVDEGVVTFNKAKQTIAVAAE